MQDRPETDCGHGAWLAKPLSLSLSFLRSGFFVCSKETNGTMTEGGGRRVLIMEVSLSPSTLSRIKRSN